MKVLGTTPSRQGDSSKLGCIVELTHEEWLTLTQIKKSGQYACNHMPYVGMNVEVCERYRFACNLQEAVKLAKGTPNTLRGMADALDAVVESAKQSITPPPDETVRVSEPTKL